MAQVLENGFVINGKYVEVLHDINAFKVGDIVEVIDEFEAGTEGYDYGWDNKWGLSMHVGMSGKIIRISEDGILLGDGFYYPSSVLKLVNKDKELIQSKLEFIATNLVNIQNLVEEIQEQLDKE